MPAKFQIDTIAVDEHEKRKNFILETEFAELLASAKKTRNSIRNQTILLLMFRHGLRCSEACNIRISDISLKTAHIWIRRLKNGLDTQHPLQGDEIRIIRRYLSIRNSKLPWLFVSERGGMLDRSCVYALIRKLGKMSKLGNINPHMLRHGCGFVLANKGLDTRIIQDYLGHRDPKHTSEYTRVSAARFQTIWDTK